MKTIVIVWGRFQPPNTGHKSLFNEAKTFANGIGADFKIFTTPTYDNKNNPLPFLSKIYWLTQLWNRFEISKDPELKTIFNVLYSLSKTYNTVLMFAGKDRVDEFHEKISPYINHPNSEKRLPLSKFEVIAANHFNPIHSKELRELVKQNDFSTFYLKENYLYDIFDCFSLFNDIKNGFIYNDSPYKKRTKKTSS